eukprot:CAMPEP_0171452066 /NCGR_PEP_ID=MMETSP0945-20130129/315_1 /TAXON_ID=109269 /ORGANISM="Vaucheria litorea, Strain CCMP2940" /LENGTH=65 /DNA_ID=CAMNT_0011976643 /DNA_START=336 /DNA_END=533 /DNA_ORIENTATION=-
MYLSAITAVTQGTAGVNFSDDVDPSVCLTISFMDQTSLDIETLTPLERDGLFEGFQIAVNVVQRV